MVSRQNEQAAVFHRDYQSLAMKTVPFRVVDRCSLGADYQQADKCKLVRCQKKVNERAKKNSSFVISHLNFGGTESFTGQNVVQYPRKYMKLCS